MTKATVAKAWDLNPWSDGSYRSYPQLTFPLDTWVDITPPVVNMAGCYGVNSMAFAPSNPSILYCCVDQRGVWKSTDGGNSWAQLGTGSYTGGSTSTIIDSPLAVIVDPSDANHVYVTQGVRGASLGFWESTDGGNTWTQPSWFTAAALTNDLTMVAQNPTDWAHVLISSHSPWSGFSNAGVMEVHLDTHTVTQKTPVSTWPAGTNSFAFAYDPSHSQGDSNRWIAFTDGDGTYLTTNAGTSWTKVSTNNAVHGGVQTYYASTGRLYSGGQPYPMYSDDNGASWSQISSLTSWYYYTVFGDGTKLFTQLANTGDNGGQGLQNYKTSAETDGATWVNDASGQTFTNGPYSMRRDSVNKKLYSCNWRAGLWVRRYA